VIENLQVTIKILDHCVFFILTIVFRPDPDVSDHKKNNNHLKIDLAILLWSTNLYTIVAISSERKFQLQQE